ncbi:MAG: helix-turn-helix transcriptional regulator [Acidobacteriaceae bacterium]|nr:helix-turn-helix transcriptional regulator [Acidobacteriaceae bacterium]MBV9766024.1 helix-turn-helix transcriptional regulator [Acidobacteriaceae bacterium]
MDADISAIAALIGDSTRARMLWALMGGLARPAGELAISANVAPQTASAHLSKLVNGKLIEAEVQGRHRYYRLASPEVGAVIEALATLAPRTKQPVPQKKSDSHPLAFARTCYSHLAGTLAVQINDALQQRGILIPTRDKLYRVTKEGRLWFSALGIPIAEIESNRSNLARQCLDWTERRHHLAGALGTELSQRFFEMKWVARLDRTRAVRVTTKGQEQLRKLLGIEFRH